MKGRRVSGNLLFCGVSGTLLSVLLVGYELIERSPGQQSPPRITGSAKCCYKSLVEVSSKPGSLPAPRTAVPRPAIEESAPGHRGSDPHSTIRTDLLLLMKRKAMSPTVVLQRL
jgi:hypothetical protein